MTTAINILHDGPLDIATGRSRKEINWKNREMMWSALVEKLSVTHRTAESYKEYISAKKPRQDEIKDIGGFVGGYISGGRRLKGSIQHRQLITLDADFATQELWEDFMLLYGSAAALYSSHKHSPDHPRYRLIIPLDRPVFADEYMAISRRIAGVIGINLFDHTTYQPERLMYWPSAAKDGVTEFQYNDAAWLSADEILNTYRDWKDTSEWPMSDLESEIIFKGIAKQGDPLEKPGIIGAFCRTYTIHEAIDQFLSDVYEPCDVEGRYTFKGGSTAAGLVTYDDKFAYSHHATDVASGKLCNAFDLVRLHKFGLKDEDCREGTPINKRPSFLSMQEFGSNDPQVRKRIINEKNQNAAEDFKEFAVEIIDEDDSWKEKLEVDRKGNIYGTIDNIVIILSHDNAFKKNLAFDEFESRPVARRNLPWRQVTHRTHFLTDRDVDNLEHYIERVYGFTPTKLEKALSVIYERNQFHPVREYLQKLDWDGESRLESVLIDYMGAEDCEYTRAVTRKSLVAAVARVMKPGIKFDYVLTLIGEQGKRKSTLLKKLGGDWFSDTFNLHMLQTKEGYEQIRGVWLVEIGEMAGMAKAEVERIKGFVSAPEDRYRVAYGRRVENFPRQCVFFGTTNKTDFLRDQTGNRRFWPVQVDYELATYDVFKDLTEDVIDQIWAEAVEVYKKGETLYLPYSLEKTAAEIQKEHTEEHPWTGIIQHYLDLKVPEDWSKMNRYERRTYMDGDEIQAEGTRFQTRICILELWSEALNRRDSIDERSASVIRNIMRSTDGWKEDPKVVRYGIHGLQRRGYVRENLPEELTKDAVTEVLQSRYNL